MIALEQTVPDGFKQTEIGVIPDDWTLFAIEDLVELTAPICYGVVQVGKHSDRGVPIVAIKYVKNIDSAPLHRSPLELERLFARSRLRGGDVLISIKGTIGRVGVVPDKFQGNISRELARIRVKQDHFPKFIAYQLEADKTQERIMKSVVGSTRLEFSILTLRKFKIAIPTNKLEQKKIVNVLSDIDSLCIELEKLIAKKQTIKVATMRELLSGEVRLPQFANYSDGETQGQPKGTKLSELGVIPKDWRITSVGEVINDYFCGPSPTCEERNIANDKEWGVLKTTASTAKNGWDWQAHKVLPKVFWGNKKIELKVNDVIVTKAGPRHRVGIAATIDYIPERVVPSGKMIALRPNHSLVHPKMLSLAIMDSRSQDYLNQRTTGMAEAQLNYENIDLLKTPIILPKIEEQTAIATILSDMDNEIQTLEQRLAKTRQIKQGMMQELLTGHTRLPFKKES